MLTREKMFVVATMVFCLVGAALVAAEPALGQSSGDQTGQVRIGTYDSRAVALAYGRSEFFSLPYDQWKRQIEMAKREGDKAKIEEAENIPKRRQNLAHMQVFGNAPIHNLLKEPPLAKAIEQQATEQRLDLVVRDIDIAHCGPSVELIDITDALVESCQPTQNTRTMIEQMSRHDPIPLEQFPIDCGHGAGHDAKTLDSPEKSGVLCATLWLLLVDDDLYAGSWEKASSHFRAVVPMKQWLKSVDDTRQPLGKVISRKVSSKQYTTSLPDAPPGKYVVVVFDTSFEKKKSAVETVTCVLDEDERWRVDGYYVR